MEEKELFTAAQNFCLCWNVSVWNDSLQASRHFSSFQWYGMSLSAFAACLQFPLDDHSFRVPSVLCIHIFPIQPFNSSLKRIWFYMLYVYPRLLYLMYAISIGYTVEHFWDQYFLSERTCRPLFEGFWWKGWFNATLGRWILMYTFCTLCKNGIFMLLFSLMYHLQI